MKYSNTLVLITVAVLLFRAGMTRADCLGDGELQVLDKRYEQALLEGDSDFLDQLLLPEFVWIHNLGVMHETRDALLGRLQTHYAKPESRIQTEVKIIRVDDTAVIHGLTAVEQIKQGERRINRYRFIRTYLNTAEGCRLLAGQTMKVWSGKAELPE